MFSIHSKKSIAALAVIFVAAIGIFLASCQKELSGEGFIISETAPDLTTKIASSVSGFVTDENDAAVNGATVQVGTANTTTDKYGYFEVSNTQVVKNAAVLTIIKPGYFKGIKTYTATADKSAFFRIKLIPKTITGNVDAATGGAVTLPNGLSVSLPANGVVVAATSAPYTGSVSIASYWIDPTGADLNRIMPGDLRGLDSVGFMKLLTTYGMSAVELTGTSGELLQIASGKKATVTFPLPASLIASAPATIPLWHFDETAGLWKQQGNAVKSGNFYTGEVSHFSYWNCDIPLTATVQLTCTIVDANGNAVPNASVSIKYANGTYTGVHGYGDTSGFVSGPVPANTQLILEVGNACNGVAYSQNFTTTNQPAALGDIQLPGVNTATVTGSLLNCANAPVTDGYVIVKKDWMTYRFPVNNVGEFSFNMTICGAALDVAIIPEDFGALQGGSLQNVTLTTGVNALGTLSACGNTIEQFINYTINSTTYSLTAPVDSFNQSINLQQTPAVMFVSSTSGNGSGGTVDNTVYFGFEQAGIGVGTTQSMNSFYSNQLRDSVGANATGGVNITEYGNVGQFVAGNFTTTLTGGPPTNTLYNITCNFRVRRYQ